MKYYLIFVIFDLSNPSTPALLGHNLYENQVTCEQAASHISREALEINPQARTAAFCVSADEFVGN